MNARGQGRGEGERRGQKVGSGTKNACGFAATPEECVPADIPIRHSGFVIRHFPTSCRFVVVVGIPHASSGKLLARRMLSCVAKSCAVPHANAFSPRITAARS